MSDDDRLHELTETGRSVRYAGRPIMAMIADALAEPCRACEQAMVLCPDDYCPNCCDAADHYHEEPDECGCYENRNYGTCGH